MRHKKLLREPETDSERKRRKEGEKRKKINRADIHNRKQFMAIYTSLPRFSFNQIKKPRCSYLSSEINLKASCQP